MITLKQVLVLYVLSAAQAITSADRKPSTQQKRALDYSYPFPIISFQEQPNKFYVETIKSVSPVGQRYLPPTGPTAAPSQNGGAKSPPISVSFNAFEPEHPSAPAKPTASAATASSSPASTAQTQAKKRPGGLGSFKYYGGSGTSNSAKSDSAASSGVAAAPAPAPTTATPKPVVIESAPATNEKPAAAKPATKNAGYDYPSPKNNRKPTKKEQKLADSKPEESGVGYQYDVPIPGEPGAILNGLSSVASGSSAGGMGLSYMRQSSPYYSFHVMLD